MSIIAECLFFCASSAPLLYLRYLPFMDKLRIKRRTLIVLLCSMFVLYIIGTVVLHHFYGPYSSTDTIFMMYRGVWVCLLFVLSCILIRDYFFRHFFVYMLNLCYSSFFLGIANYVAARLPEIDSFVVSFLVVAAILLLTFPGIAYFYRKYLTPLVDTDNRPLWRVAWLIPFIFFYVFLFITIYMTDAGSWLYLVMRSIMLVASIICSVLVVIILQQTRQKVAHEAALSEIAKLTELKTHFLQNISHDLNTPVTALKLTLERLKDCHHPDQHLEYYNILCHNTNDIERLVGNLLDISRLTTCADGYHLQPISLAELFPQIQEKYEDVLESAGISLGIRFNSDVHLIADCNKLWSVLDNIIYNAQRYTPEGGYINIRASCDAVNTHIYIADNGCGIESAHLPYIFEQGVAYGDKAGSGVGLFIVKSLMENMNGSVTVHSRVGKGTVLCLSFCAGKDCLA